MKIILLKEVKSQWHFLMKDEIITLPLLRENKREKLKLDLHFEEAKDNLNFPDGFFVSYSSSCGYAGVGFGMKNNIDFVIISEAKQTKTTLF